MGEITKLFKYVLWSVKFVNKHKLYVYFIPAIILAILFYVTFLGGSFIAGSIEFMEDWWIVGPLLNGVEAAIKFIAFFTFEIVILVLLTPINSYLAEKVYEEISGEKLHFDLRQFLMSIVRAIRIFIVAFLVEIILLLFVWIVAILLGNIFYTILAYGISSYFIGFSFFDFGLELDRKNSRTSWRFAKENKWLCILTGLIFSLSIYLPEQIGFVELFLLTIALVPHLLTIASTKMYFDVYSEKDQ